MRETGKTEIPRSEYHCTSDTGERKPPNKVIRGRVLYERNQGEREYYHMRVIEERVPTL